MASLERNVDLKVNHSLIDANFDSYKLSLDHQPIYSINLENGLDIARLTDDQYSYQHIKAFGLHNHLIGDPWNAHCVYFIDQQWRVTRVAVTEETRIEKPVSVLQVPNAQDHKLAPGRHNVTLHFTSSEWVVIADGTGFMHVIQTGDRKDTQTWKIKYSCTVTENERPFTLVHSSIHSCSENIYIDCLLLHVEEEEAASGDAHGNPFHTVLEWITLASADHVTWTVERTRRFMGQAAPDWAGLESGGKAAHIATEKPFKMTYDSLRPVEEPEPEKNGEEKALPSYTFTQTVEDLTVQFTIPDGKSKADVLYKLSHDHISLELNNAGVLLQGNLHGNVDVEASTWTLSGQRLDVYLNKSETGIWPVVVTGDKRGEQMLDEEQASVIHQRLAHLTSEIQNPDPQSDMKKPYNAQQLEDCDAYPDEAAMLQRFDGESHEITHQVHLSSHQWLFNSQLEPGKLPALCLRHDVDGILWQPNETVIEGVSPWEHVATFNAFGYVQASKRDKKFSMCSPDQSYAVICDCVRHVYIYKQPSQLLAPIRNRKTGREVGAVAKQYVVSLESTDNIMGIQATNTRIFIVTNKLLYVVKLRAD